jgi:hypothetical protein
MTRYEKHDFQLGRVDMNPLWASALIVLTVVPYRKYQEAFYQKRREERK